jgi:multiple sugar transport system permease protein
MAVSIIQLLPVLIIFFLAQKLFVQGVTLTGMGGK